MLCKVCQKEGEQSSTPLVGLTNLCKPCYALFRENNVDFYAIYHRSRKARERNKKLEDLGI